MVNTPPNIEGAFYVFKYPQWQHYRLIVLSHMWQSQIEIEYYSVTYFEHITEFDVQ